MKVLYFAWVREKAGIGEEQVAVPDSVQTVSDLIDFLSGRGPQFAAAFERRDVIRAAVDAEHVDHDAPVANAREVAFFPPVTGG